MQRVGSELGGMALGGVQPPQLGGDLLHADARGGQQWRAAHKCDRGRASGECCAAAGGIEASVGDRAIGARGVEREGDAHEIAARGSTGGAGVCVVGRVPAPARALQMRGEERLGGHAAEFRRRPGTGTRPKPEILACDPYPLASAIACSSANASVSPVIVVTSRLGLMISSVGVW